MIRSHENRNMRIYAYNYDDPKGHAARLIRGLAALGPNFLASLCVLCKGEGQRQQMYNPGHGGRLYPSMGKCDYCDGLGLTQNGKPAPLSVMHQVLNASEREPYDAIVFDHSCPGDTGEASGVVTGRWASRSGHITEVPRTPAARDDSYDPTLHCDNKCLRAGYCMGGKCFNGGPGERYGQPLRIG